jgi:hypothetical protein
MPPIALGYRMPRRFLEHLQFVARLARCIALYSKILMTNAEALHLFESGTGRGAGSWPVWGVNFGLPPVARTDL